MKEIYIIYNTVTGFIERGMGRIDREWDAANADGSTQTERIPLILAKYPDLAVVYLPDQPLPDRTKHKIDRGEMVVLTKEEESVIMQPILDEEKIGEERQALARQEAIQSLKDKGELPPDYTDISSP